MGKQRINRLLSQLKDNRQQDIQNAASIFTVAQVAANELELQAGDSDETSEKAIAALPAAPSGVDKAELLRRYGSYNGCRSAAKQEGITFRKTPSWNQLIAGFSYAESIRQLAKHYLVAYPHPELGSIAVTVDFGNALS